MPGVRAPDPLPCARPTAALGRSRGPSTLLPWSPVVLDVSVTPTFPAGLSPGAAVTRRLLMGLSPHNPPQAGARMKLLRGRRRTGTSHRHGRHGQGCWEGGVPRPPGTPRPARGFGRFLRHTRPLLQPVWLGVRVHGLEYISN